MTSSAQHKPNPVMRFIVTFLVIYLVTTLTLRIFFPERFNAEQQEVPPITLNAPTRTVLGRNIAITLINNTTTDISLKNRCPEPPVLITTEAKELILTQPVTPCTAPQTLPAESSAIIDLSPWKYAAFSEVGNYTITLPESILEQVGGSGSVSSTLTIKHPNTFVGLFRALISKPLLNGLIFIASLLPGHSLGWSIIILTLIVRFVLFFPSQHAMEGQKKLQALQPKLDEIKKKFKDNQQKVTEETMKLWKQEKVNPFQSCLPTLIQMPILFGLFFIIRDSNAIELAQHLLYTPFLSLDWSLNTLFLGFLDLNYIPYADVTSWFPTIETIKTIAINCPLPLSIALLQGTQMQMAFAKNKKKNETKKPFIERMDAQSMMVYMLPIMLFFIAGSLPAAVSLYWGTGTIFSIAQQFVVNKKK